MSKKSRKSLKQREQAMMAEMENAQRMKSSNLTQNEAKFHEPNRPSV